jgi:hypothetical protein
VNSLLVNQVGSVHCRDRHEMKQFKCGGHQDFTGIKILHKMKFLMSAYGEKGLLMIIHV